MERWAQWEVNYLAVNAVRRDDLVVVRARA